MANRRPTLDDLITREARELALRLLESRLHDAGLPLPKDSQLELHLGQIILMKPELRDMAKARVLAQQDAYSESLRAIGLPVPDLPIPLEIDL